jgi:methionyl-tRNA formyltransferase
MTNQQLEKKRVVFLGTPAIVVPVLQALHAQSDHFCVAAVVSQPPSRALRGRGMQPSPVHLWATEAGLPVLTPDDARSPEFISQLEEIQPDVCVTAAYGQVLSEAFLAIPKYGTLNIHPSLLPLFRGAAPVQRALESGVTETGVTIAQTVRALDAGPIVSQLKIPVDSEIKAPELLEHLFALGAQELVRLLPDYFAGRCPLTEQDHAKATKAKKMNVEEALLQPAQQTAWELHNKVRAFSGWPGCRLLVRQGDETLEMKVITATVSQQLKAKTQEIFFISPHLAVVCGDGSVLLIRELQVPGKRILSAHDYWNGLRIKSLNWI